MLKLLQDDEDFKGKLGIFWIAATALESHETYGLIFSEWLVQFYSPEHICADRLVNEISSVFHQLTFFQKFAWETVIYIHLYNFLGLSVKEHQK